MKKTELQRMYPKHTIYTNWADVPENLYTETKLKREKIVKNLKGLGSSFVALFSSRVRSDAYYFLYDVNEIQKIKNEVSSVDAVS